MKNFPVFEWMAAAALLFAALPVQADEFAELSRDFSGFDLDRDGTVEIESLAPLAGVDPGAAEGPLVLVLVEARLLAPSHLPGTGPERGTRDPLDLVPALSTLAGDLAKEGWRPRVLSAALYAGERHQDGRTLLALREFFRRVRALDPSFAGAVLVGAFPEAFLVRSCNWRKKEPIVLRAGSPDEKRFEEPVDFLRTMPEEVAHRCEIVLCDLDGRWEDLYTEPRERIAWTIGVYPGGVPAKGGVTSAWETGSWTFQDFFHANDGRLEVREVLAPSGEVTGLHLVPLDDCVDWECSEADLARPNRIARPEILVSRVNARGVARRPKAGLAGADGEGLLDEHGRPRAVRFESPEKVPHWRDGIWEADTILEKRLLLEYFERNHRYRTGEQEVAWRPASLACGLPSGYDVVSLARPEWKDLPREGLDVSGNPGLAEVVRWLQRPAVLRTIRAHSDRWGCVFEAGDAGSLDEVAGGTPWSWTPRGAELVPSLAASSGGGKLDFFLLRTLWENRALPENASFYIHTGCESISPGGAAELPYSHPGYGVIQGGEAILFYAQGLALVGRAKVFYDEPRGFSEALAEGRTFGEAWARYFEIESSAASWDEVGGDIGRKRAYFWSAIGDWTLRLRGPEKAGGG
ncbi:MAG: hypothetical protein HY720_27195 [Planctomycetes bacterium]|nr:hypothetical protein [Planctomycetota bacterium]